MPAFYHVTELVSLANWRGPCSTGFEWATSSAGFGREGRNSAHTGGMAGAIGGTVGGAPTAGAKTAAATMSGRCVSGRCKPPLRFSELVLTHFVVVTLAIGKSRLPVPPAIGVNSASKPSLADAVPAIVAG